VFQIQVTAREALNIRDAFLNPSALGVGGETAFYFLNPLLLVLPLLLLKIRDARLLALACPALAYATLLLIRFPENNLRYFIPAIVPLTIACTVIAVNGTEVLPNVLRSAVRVMLVLVTLMPSVATVYFWLAGTEALGNLSGRRSAEEYLLTHISPTVRSHARVTMAANALLSPNSNVLMVYESRGLYFDARTIEDTRLTNWQSLAAALGPDRCLDTSGITHVLARPAVAKVYEQRGVPAEVLGRASFERFAQRCLTPLYSDGDATLYAVRPIR
jgi:hypothetical protein